MKSIRWGFLLILSIFLLISSSIPVSAAKAKYNVITQEFIVSFTESSDDGGGIMPMTISSSNLSIIVSYTPVKDALGTVTYMDITVTWQWLNSPNYYMEDSLAISWDTTNVQWRNNSSTILRKNYYKYYGSTSWILGGTDTSVEETCINGFLYDQQLMRLGNGNPGTLNKGTIHFHLEPTTNPDVSSTETIYVNYYHKFLDILGLQANVSIGSIATGGVLTPSFGFGIGTKYDSRGISVIMQY